MQLQSNMDPDQWKAANAAYARIIANAEKAAIHQVGIKARDDVRAMIGEAGFGPRWQKSFVARFGTEKGSAFNPFALIHSTINYAGVFETGKTITGNLWLPLPQVPPIAGRPHMTPSQYVANVGPLVTMRVPGKPPMLGAQIRVQDTGNIVSKRRLRRGRGGSGGTLQTIPMFVLVTSATIPKKWDIHGTVVEAAKGLNEAYEQNMEKYDGGA
jgi:hypothetical protein